MFVIRKNKSRASCAFDNGLDTELFHCSMILAKVQKLNHRGFWWDLVGTEAKKAFKDAYVNFLDIHGVLCPTD
jgi:hypothetical protein